MTTRRRVLWASSLAPWVVAALVWGVVQLAQSTGSPRGESESAADEGASDAVGRAVGTVQRPTRTATPASHVASGGPDWAAILDRLDRRRERAYAASEPNRLTAVYVSGSVVLRHDQAILRAYRERGVRLTDVRLRAIDVAMLRRDGPYARLRVVDRLDRPTAHTSEGSVRLPRDQATERVIVLRDGAGGWRIAAVRPA